MGIEGSMGETGTLHQGGDADTAEALAAQLLSGALEDARAHGHNRHAGCRRDSSRVPAMVNRACEGSLESNLGASGRES
jgi:hypothetical protein